MHDFDPRRIVLALVDHGVDFVIIGASAAILQGAPIAATLDLDVCAEGGSSNRRRLAAALEELEARLRLPDPDEVIYAPLDENMLRNLAVVTTMTRFGPLDVLFEPAGAPPYDDLLVRSEEVRAYGVVVRAASIDDIMAMKRAAGREKDAAHLAALVGFQRDQRRRREPPSEG